MRYRLALLLSVLSGTAAAQRQGPAARGAGSIVATDVQRRIGIIADDSMLGRATPSPQLDAVAAYVAGEFRRFGLKPGGDSGTYFQHYPLEVLRFDPDSATIRITGRMPGIEPQHLEGIVLEVGAAVRSRQRDHPDHRPYARALARRPGRAARAGTAAGSGGGGVGRGDHGFCRCRWRARFRRRHRKVRLLGVRAGAERDRIEGPRAPAPGRHPGGRVPRFDLGDRKSTRLNSSHGYISYAVFCLKKKNQYPPQYHTRFS